jgi:methionine sulfoxide reductase heme-binding subunit
MSNIYRVVQWNRHKRVYDGAIAGFVVLFVAAFFIVGSLVWTGENAVGPEVMLIRALAVCAIVLLHIVLCIGPAARISDRFAPLLYNRRHLGVAMFTVALAHALLATLYYGGFASRNPLAVVLESGSFASLSGFPFEWLGLLAILILFMLAATSHDFWLVNLGPRLWKWLHMSVYIAYAAIVGHVLLGAFQTERGAGAAVALLVGVTIVATLHTIAGFRESSSDARTMTPADDGWIDAAGVDEIPDCRAKVVRVAGGDHIALFRRDESFSAVSNVCAHQGGPLGEGKIVGGCITCPWHGYQYLPHNGQSPPPYTEKIATYEVRVRGERVEVRAGALPPGTPVEPAQCAARSVAAQRRGQRNTQETGV